MWHVCPALEAVMSAMAKQVLTLYVAPYQRVSLVDMVAAFGDAYPGDDAVDIKTRVWKEVVALVRSDATSMPFRIDSLNKVCGMHPTIVTIW